MNISRDQWIARCASAVCVASRWFSCASLALALVSLCCLFFLAMPPLAQLAVVAVAGTGAAQAYLAARVEFDRIIFESLATATDAVAAAESFDAAAQDAGLLPARNAGRDLAQRAAGLVTLTNAIFFVFLFQLALLLAAAWTSR
jgi:hypothetical protein